MAYIAVPKRGYLAEVTRFRPRGLFEHTVGGKNDLPGAFCAPCKQPLLLMMSLDTRDRRLGLRLPRGRKESEFRRGGYVFRTFFHVPLLYCWSCGPMLTYRLNPEGGVDVLDYTKDRMDAWVGACLPYEPYPASFPRRYLRLKALAAEAQRLIHQDNAGKLRDHGLSAAARSHLRPRHQVGGEPHFQQRSCVNGGWTCTLCRRETPLIASVADETGSQRTFHGGAYVQVIFHYCAPCQVVSAYHECD